MSVLLISISSLFLCVNSQETVVVGNLEIVSDLKPIDCLNAGKNYILDKTNFLPRCDPTFDNKQYCNRNWGSTYTGAILIKPTDCAIDGTYGPVQCKGEKTTGRCFCFDDRGKRLFGQQWWDQAQNMTCACTRRKADMSNTKATNYIFYSSLHCDSMGNFEPLQCDVVSGQCWCADERTGDLVSTVVPQAAMAKLPCYDTLKVGTQYLRECESKRYAQKNIENQLLIHGTTSTFGDFLCDGDGSYGPFIIIDGSAYCTWRDGTKIGSWSSNAEAKDTLNCNCARDTKYFGLAGKEQLQQCGPVGNYKANQGAGDGAYCVDKDGYRKSKDGAIINQESDCDASIAYDD